MIGGNNGPIYPGKGADDPTCPGDKRRSCDGPQILQWETFAAPARWYNDQNSI
jgi:hypothetical protein